MTLHLKRAIIFLNTLILLMFAPGGQAQGQVGIPRRFLGSAPAGPGVDLSKGMGGGLQQDRFFPSLLGLRSPGLNAIRTEHFVIYYGEADQTARQVADIAEEVFDAIAPLYPKYMKNYAPVHVLVDDALDFGNGSASYYQNFIEIWATNLDFELRGTHAWIKNVFAHEFTHIVTLKAARRNWPFELGIAQMAELNRNPDYVLAMPFYQLAVPTWFAEGIAQYEDDKMGYEAWDTHRDMLLRMATLEDDLLSYAEMGVFSRDGHHFEMSYNQGYNLLRYIDETYGPDKVRALSEHTGLINFKSAIRTVLHKSADRVYDEWKAHLKAKYGAVADSLQKAGLVEGEKAIDEGFLDYFPAHSPDGKRVAYLSNRKSDFAITELRVKDLATGEMKTISRGVDNRFSWSPDGKKIYYNRAPRGRFDIYVYDFDTKEERKLTLGLRAKDPAVSPDGKRIAFVRNEDGTNNIGIMNADGTKVHTLTHHNDATQYYGPRWSPDGKRIAFSVFRGEDRDIAVINADAEPFKKVRSKADSSKTFPDSLAYANNAGFEALIRTKADERDPCWLPDGSGLVFASDRTGIFNLYEYDLASKQVKQLTHVLGGAFCPSVSPAGDEVLYGGFHAGNYSLYRVKRSEARPAPALQLVDRDYRGIYTGEPTDKAYKVGRYGTHITLNGVEPFLVLGPTFIGNRFGLDQISAGLQVAAGDLLGGDQIVSGFSVGKNLRKSIDINSSVLVGYMKSLTPFSGENKTYSPTLYTFYSRETINSALDLGTVAAQRDTLLGTLRVDTDSGRVLIPNVTQFLHLSLDESDRFKDVFNEFVLGVDLPISSRHGFDLEYSYQKFYENMHTRQTVLDSSKVFQQGRDITDQIKKIDKLFGQPQVIADQNLYSSESGPFFRSSNLAVSWRYGKMNPTIDGFINPAGRFVTLGYRRLNATVADSLAEAIRDPNTGLPVPTVGNPSPEPFLFDHVKLGINEFTFSWNEFIPLGGRATLGLQTFVGYKDAPIKGFNPNGGPFEGAFYYPLRYYLGGWGSLRGYPYFTLEGGKAVLGRVSLTLPLFQKIRKELPPLYFDRLYATLFLETGATGDFEKLSDLKFNSQTFRRAFLSDAGVELRMQMFSFYRLPMFGFFQFVMPFTRDVRDRNDPTRINRVDARRFFFGFTI